MRHIKWHYDFCPKFKTIIEVPEDKHPKDFGISFQSPLRANITENFSATTGLKITQPFTGIIIEYHRSEVRTDFITAHTYWDGIMHSLDDYPASYYYRPVINYYTDEDMVEDYTETTEFEEEDGTKVREIRTYKVPMREVFKMYEYHWYDNGCNSRFTGPAFVKYGDNSKKYKDNSNVKLSSTWTFHKNDVKVEHETIHAWARENFIDLNNVTKEDIELIKMKWDT